MKNKKSKKVKKFRKKDLPTKECIYCGELLRDSQQICPICRRSEFRAFHVE